MSDIDFDALRDPDEPRPGARERDGVRARARQLRTRSRVNRLALSSVSVVAVLALVLGVVASQRDEEPQIVVGGGSTTTSPTTTTAPDLVTQSAPAVSASFVSPDHGWVVQRNGNIAETTDGGATWHRVGNVGVSPATGMHLRFADPNVGYVFDDTQVLATADGGATWTKLRTPYPGAFDLEIANGTAYVASFDSSSAGIDVWTTPTGTEHWTRHPTGVPVGAGPVPSTQLVFSGGRGWLLQVDRTVVGGAQLTSAGDWAAWTPPCAGVNGPAWLSASSAVDVVASCDEHTYGGGPVVASIWFSHDGGQAFSRQTAPESGPVATPKGSKAVVVGMAGIQRTTDEGATWQASFVAGLSSIDLGFTTATQGFIILDNGEMLMTYDAGTTWKEVTLP